MNERHLLHFILQRGNWYSIKIILFQGWRIASSSSILPCLVRGVFRIFLISGRLDFLCGYREARYIRSSNILFSISSGLDLEKVIFPICPRSTAEHASVPCNFWIYDLWITPSRIAEVSTSWGATVINSTTKKYIHICKFLKTRRSWILLVKY